MKKFVIPAMPKVELVPTSGGTPDHIRQAKSKQALMEAGGLRLSVNLTAEAVGHLRSIQRREDIDATTAIIDALAHYAMRQHL
jgi:hypothetical protein